MRELFRSKYAKWGITAAIVMVVAIILYFFMLRASSVSQAIALVGSILTPFIYGFVLAYLLRPIYNRFEGLFYKIMQPRIKKEGRARSLAKGLSTAVSILLLLILIVGTLSIVLPQLVASIYSIVMAAPDAFDDFIAWVNHLPFFTRETKDIIENAILNFQDTVLEWIKTDILPNLKDIVTQVSNGVIGAINVLMNIVIGVIICIYILFSKEQFAAQCKKAIYALFHKNTANEIIYSMRFVDKVFNGYLVGKIIDSFVVGIICFVVMVIFQWPYAMLISVLVGVTNIIPFFGPFIGGIPSAILILTVDPMACVYFVIFITILQQIEGNIIAPKILGDSTGLSSFWVMFSILIGGGLFGFMGMIIGVPIFAVIYAFISGWLKVRLAKRRMPIETETYTDLAYVSEETDKIFTFEEIKQGGMDMKDIFMKRIDQNREAQDQNWEAQDQNREGTARFHKTHENEK